MSKRELRKPKLKQRNFVSCAIKKPGVKSETNEHGSHSWFETKDYLFDPNDSKEWLEYNFHKKSKKARPLAGKENGRTTHFNYGYEHGGICHLIANAISNFWYDKDRNDLFTWQKIAKLKKMSRDELLSY